MIGKISMLGRDLEKKGNHLARTAGRDLARYTARTSAGQVTLSNVATAAAHFQKSSFEDNQGRARPTNRAIARTWRDVKIVPSILYSHMGFLSAVGVVGAGIVNYQASGMSLQAIVSLGLCGPTILLSSATSIACMLDPLSASKDAYVAQAVLHTWVHASQADASNDTNYRDYLSQYYGGRVDDCRNPANLDPLMQTLRPEFAQVITTDNLDEAKSYAKFMAKHDPWGLRSLLDKLCEPPSAHEQELENISERKKIVAQALFDVSSVFSFVWLTEAEKASPAQNILELLSELDAQRVKMWGILDDLFFSMGDEYLSMQEITPTARKIRSFAEAVKEEAYEALADIIKCTTRWSGPFAYEAAFLLGAFGVQGRAKLFEIYSGEEFKSLPVIARAYVESLMLIKPEAGEPPLSQVIYPGASFNTVEQVRYLLDQGLDLSQANLEHLPGRSEPTYLSLQSHETVAIEALIQTLRHKGGRNKVFAIRELAPLAQQGNVRAALEADMIDEYEDRTSRIAAADALLWNASPASSEAFAKVMQQDLALWKAKPVEENYPKKYELALVVSAIKYTAAQAALPDWVSNYVDGFLSIPDPNGFHVQGLNFWLLIEALASNVVIQQQIATELGLRVINKKSARNIEANIGALLKQYALLGGAGAIDAQKMMRERVFLDIFMAFNAPIQSDAWRDELIVRFKMFIAHAKKYKLDQNGDPLFVQLDAAIRRPIGLKDRERDVMLISATPAAE